MEQECTKITPSPEVATHRRQDLTSSPSISSPISVPTHGHRLRPRLESRVQQGGRSTRTSNRRTGSAEDGSKLVSSLPQSLQHEVARLQEGNAAHSSGHPSRPCKRKKIINPKRPPGQSKASDFTPQRVVDGAGNKALRFKYTLAGEELHVQIKSDIEGVDLEKDLSPDFMEQYACYPTAMGTVDVQNEYHRSVNEIAWKLKFINPHGDLDKGSGILQRAAEAYLEVNSRPSRRVLKQQRRKQQSTSSDTGRITNPALAPLAHQTTSSPLVILPPLPLIQPMDVMPHTPFRYYADVDERYNAEGDQAQAAWAYGGGSYELASVHTSY